MKSFNRVCSLLQIELPIIQAGMVWCSGWKLASACTEAGILGVLGAGSMHPPTLRAHIGRMRAAGHENFAVNLPLLYPEMDALLALLVEERVPIVITSAGSPVKHTARLKDAGMRVLHVVSSARFAEKAQAAGVDAIICEGFEAGGHNGRAETTTLCLVPDVRRATDLPLVAAGGIASGKAMLAAMALGAEAVQVGSRFAAAAESSAHHAFKERVVAAGEGETVLTLKELAPVRLLKNTFYEEVSRAYQAQADVEQLSQLLGKGRAKKGIFEGDLTNGELEIGQVASQIHAIEPAAAIVQDLIDDYRAALAALNNQGL